MPHNEPTNKDNIRNDISDCYICVLHFPLISAWITPTSYPVRQYVVAYNGKYDGSSCKCHDGEEQIMVKIEGEDLILEFGTYNKKLPYVMNELCLYNIPLCDAMESWGIIVSDTPIQHELFMEGYEVGFNGVCYNTEDRREWKRRLLSF